VREAELDAACQRVAALRQGARPEELTLARDRLASSEAEVRRSTGDAEVASRLAEAALGTRSSADAADARRAVSAGAADAARWAVSRLAAGARPEEIAAAEAQRARLAGELSHLRAEEALLVLRSPIDGVIATPHLEEKLQAALAPGDLFAEVHDLDEAVAEIALATGDPLAEIRIGDEVELRLHGAPGAPITAPVERFREAAQDTGGERRVVAITAPFSLARPVTGLTGHARIHGAEHSLAYASFYLPLQRLFRVRLWSVL
jgi:hypothetical protein